MLIKTTGLVVFSPGEEDETSYEASASFNIIGSRMTGTISFNDFGGRIIPLSLIISGTQVKSISDQYFIDPNGTSTRIFPIQLVDTSITSDFSEISISATIGQGELELGLLITQSNVPLVQNNDSVLDPPTIGNIRKTLVKKRINQVGNVLDHLGSIVSLPRSSEEGNASYSSRIKQVSSRRPNSTYDGLVNGLAIDLGIPIEVALNVKLRPNLGIVRGHARLLVDDFSIYIYEKWVDESDQELGLRPILERSCSLDSPEINTVGKLNDWINQSSIYSSKVEGNPLTQTLYLLNADSRKTSQDRISQEITELSAKNLVPGSITYSKSQDFMLEVGSGETLNETGQFAINYETSVLKVYKTPAPAVNIVYLYSAEDFELETCEIKLIDLAGKPALKKYFEQIDQPFWSTVDTKTRNGLPTDSMYEIIRDILTTGQFNQYWGE